MALGGQCDPCDQERGTNAEFWDEWFMGLINERGRSWWRDRSDEGQRWLRRQILLVIAIAVAGAIVIAFSIILLANGVHLDAG